MSVLTQIEGTANPIGGSAVPATAAIDFGDVPFGGSPAVAAIGGLTFTLQPQVGDMLSIANAAYEFVAGSPGPNQIQIGANVQATGTNIANKINLIFIDASVVTSYAVDIGSETVTITWGAPGAGGNEVVLSVAGSDHIQVTPFGGGADVARGESLTVGTIQFFFGEQITALDNSGTVGDEVAEVINNNTEGSHGSGTFCTAILDGNGHVDLVAATPGSAGNSIVLDTDSPNITLTPFSGGSD